MDAGENEIAGVTREGEHGRQRELIIRKREKE